MKFLCFLVLTLGLIATAPFAVEAKQNSHSKTTVEKKKNRDTAKERATTKRSSERTERKKERETARREKRSYDRKKQEQARADIRERRMSAKNRKADREERLNARHARSNDRKARTLSRREQRVQAARKRHSYALSRRNAQTRRSRARKELASLDYIQPIEPKRVRRKTSRTTPSNTPSDFTRDTKWMDDGNELAGKASWYGKDFHGGKTASGLRYDMYTFTAAHRTLPLGTVVKVTTLDEGKSVVVCVTDRGPYVRGRVIDLSYAAATQLGLRNKGIGDVNLEIICDKDGKPLKKKQAFFVQYKAQQGNEKAGPFKEFADACAMQEALRQAHPDAAVILDSTR